MTFSQAAKRHPHEARRLRSQASVSVFIRVDPCPIPWFRLRWSGLIRAPFRFGFHAADTAGLCNLRNLRLSAFLLMALQKARNVLYCFRRD